MRNLIIAGIALCLLSPLAQAQKAFEKGDWIVRAGASVVDPDSKGLDLGGGTYVSADSAASLTINGEYLFADSWGVELLAAYPFEHDIEIDGVGKVGSTKQLPPTLNIKWHPSIGMIAPYIGVGVNWTIFFSEETTGVLSGSSLSLDDSFGIGGQIGFDWVFANNWLLNADVRYIQIETDANLDGDDLGSVDINPWVYGLHVGYKF